MYEEVEEEFCKNWCKSKKKAFAKYSKTYETDEGKKNIEGQLEKLIKYATVIRVNGGPIAEKVEFAKSFFEKQIPIDAVFQKDEMIGIIGVTKGKGYEAVVTRRGLRKVASIGAWHPARVSFTVARL
ncbi:putative ribosomal protein L3 [Rosa chinensis]|uniref:Putative ribosomal protein L3 n=1 Tax=Rosa chinensis TaxID=74649 RepID=A0A2P6SIX7_ROSCH|nr:putative ribosomal protein L3 [Rosa chinensis]